MRTALPSLPHDILILILRDLSIPELAALSQTCHALYNIILQIGWHTHAVYKPLPSPSFVNWLCSLKKTYESSLSPSEPHFLTFTHESPALSLLKYQSHALRSWTTRSFTVRPLGPEWGYVHGIGVGTGMSTGRMHARLHPVIALSDGGLCVAAGNAVVLYRFGGAEMHGRRNGNYGPPRVSFERILSFPKDAKKDIAGIAFEPGGESLVVGFVNGYVGRVKIGSSNNIPQGGRKENIGRSQCRVETARGMQCIRAEGTTLRSMSVYKDRVLTIDAGGQGEILPLESIGMEGSTSSTVETGAPGWSAYLGARHGILGRSVYSIAEGGFHPRGESLLSPWARNPEEDTTNGAVYSICGVTSTFPSGVGSDQVIVGGWYHGSVTVHDLRCPTYTSTSHISNININNTHRKPKPTLAPVLTLKDLLTRSAIYSVSSCGTHIVAGSAQHSLVHLYDVRAPKSGWNVSPSEIGSNVHSSPLKLYSRSSSGYSIYLPQPQNRSSPVYATVLEGTRLWCATESRAWVVDFGRVGMGTYPGTRSNARGDANRVAKEGVSPTSRGQRGSRDVRMEEGDRGTGWYAPVCEHSLFKSRRPAYGAE